MSASTQTRVSYFIMFDGEASSALELYTSAFKEALRDDYFRVVERVDAANGTVETARCVLGDARLMVIDSPIKHDFSLNPATSLFVDTGSADVVDMLAEKLGADGKVLMPLGTYPFAKRFTWVCDKFGVSWQLSFVEESKGTM